MNPQTTAAWHATESARVIPVSISSPTRRTAPETGLYTFDTIGSNFDTTLSFRTPCSFGNAEFACNDDDGSVQSSLTFDFFQGDSVVVVIDTYAGPECGDYVLNIARVP